MRLDGQVYPVDECISPIDEQCTPRLRALALTALLPPRLIVEQLTAAWVWGAVYRAPDRRQVCVDIGARARPVNLHGLAIREVVIAKEHIVDVAGLSITSPLRTAVDLARFLPRFAVVESHAVAHLMRIGGFGVEECLRAMSTRRNLPNKKRALSRLQESACQPELTR